MVKTLIGPHLITTSPSATTCRTCGRMVLAATVAGIDRHLDTATLNDYGELAAVLAGRRTYEAHGDLLIQRTALRLRQPRDPATPVLADHGCTPILDGHIDHTHTEAALALVVRVLGGRFTSDPEAIPPF